MHTNQRESVGGHTEDGFHPMEHRCDAASPGSPGRPRWWRTGCSQSSPRVSDTKETLEDPHLASRRVYKIRRQQHHGYGNGEDGTCVSLWASCICTGCHGLRFVESLYNNFREAMISIAMEFGSIDTDDCSAFMQSYWLHFWLLLSCCNVLFLVQRRSLTVSLYISVNSVEFC